MKTIQLTQNKQTVVDDTDYVWLSQWKWYYDNHGYAITNDYSTGKHKHIRMHRLITNAPKGMDVDHVDMNKLNNTRGNLRICNRSENMCNTKLKSSNTSGIKGVTWDKTCNKWMAGIMVNYKRINLGRFSDINKAQEAYEQAAIKYHKEFARFK